MALRILAAVESRAGRIDGVVAGPSYPDGSEEDVALIFATRFAAVFGQLITARDLKITATDYERLLSYYRWIDLIFSLTDSARRTISSASSPRTQAAAG